ncbi:UDP-glucose 4-epimerase GalE [Halothermothrix orenii]|uniref:UDP-glucose 4-epimerase n=1 Tax=Halothermothrix orenii (strain H 168 / OCM 544 / DSM 9562) TaxID=373903 RepID=B8CZW1_HALOH|nr:UDP-glucose 4-epimerase GalE [Halothermothrix orenii]ACL70813.1 UDP-glucose 4-epimerase [Halothermothrix orenii H 168]
MNILVTGGAGYIGSHVVKSLFEAGYNVVTLDNLEKGHREAVLGGEFIKGDLKDRELLDSIMKDYEIDGVIHLAAHSLVGESMENPGKYYKNNVSNGLNLLEAMVDNDVKYLVFSSTAAVYGEPREVPITEDHPTAPTNTYGESKLFFEKMMKRYDEIYGLKYVSLRYFNAAGADLSGKIGEDHDPETHLIPIVLQKALGLRDKLYIFGNDYPTRDGTCIRDYIHVNDLADAHVLAIEGLTRGLESRIYNLGNGEGYSVKEVIETASRVIGKPIEAGVGDRRPGDPAVLVASSDKIKEELGWDPQYPDLETIIETAWQWHKRGGFNENE